MTIAVRDITVPPTSRRCCRWPTTQGQDRPTSFQRGLITDDERYEQVVEIWKDTTQTRSPTA